MINLRLPDPSPPSHQARDYRRVPFSAKPNTASQQALDVSVTRNANQELGALAHELRNFLQTACLALAVLKAADAQLGAASTAVLERSLGGMRNLIDRTIGKVRAGAGIESLRTPISLADLIAEVAAGARLSAEARRCPFTVSPVERAIMIEVDRDLVLSAISNLLQNAFKFTRPGTPVYLNAYAAGDLVRIDVEDHCGGIPATRLERLFLPFTQASADNSGLGLGLSICRGNIEASGGTVTVKDKPGTGCVFTIQLPRHIAAPAPRRSSMDVRL